MLRMDLMHSGNLIILYTMSGCIPSYGAHCPSRNTPQRYLRKRGDWIWGDLVAHSSLRALIRNYCNLKFIYSKKGTVNLSHVVQFKSMAEISQNFVAFSEYMNFQLNMIQKVRPIQYPFSVLNFGSCPS